MRMKRIVLGALGILIGMSLANAAPTPKKMNVLFIAIDDLNDWIGCVGGNPQVQTPNIDQFHTNGGMVMYDAHCPSTVCGPSRSALLTGVRCHRTGVYGNITYRGGEELYDHKKDPSEWINQARNPEFAPIKARLKKYLPKTKEPPSPVNPFDGNKKVRIK